MSHAVLPKFRGPDVTVLDRVALTLAERKPMVIKRYRKRQRRKGKGTLSVPVTFFPRRYWRKGRDLALERYTAAIGYRFHVVESAPLVMPGLDLADLTDDIPSREGEITIARNSPGTGANYARVEPFWAWNGSAWVQNPSVARGLAVCEPYTGVFSHEFGHLLGLQHTSPGGAPNAVGGEHGVMDYVGLHGWELPAWDGHDLEALRGLYGE